MHGPDAERPDTLLPVLQDLVSILDPGGILPGGSLEGLLDRLEMTLWEDR